MKLCKGAVLALAVSYGLIYCHTNKSKFMLEQKGDSLTLIHITNPTNYILLPIEEAAEESRVRLDIGDAADTDMDIRLAQTKVDYWVPFVLPADAKTVTVRVQKSLGDALCWKEMKLSDTFDPSHTDKFRPVYHHAPLYGWMNNANGLLWKMKSICGKNSAICFKRTGILRRQSPSWKMPLGSWQPSVLTL